MSEAFPLGEAGAEEGHGQPEAQRELRQRRKAPRVFRQINAHQIHAVRTSAIIPLSMNRASAAPMSVSAACAAAAATLWPASKAEAATAAPTSMHCRRTSASGRVIST